jgi:hypothetical protein
LIKRKDLTGLAWRWLVGLALLALPLARAEAQELVPAPPKQNGAFFVPMLTLSEALDDNLFFTQFPEADFVTRVGLGLQTGYRSTRFTIDAQGSRAADFFGRHPDFDTMNGRSFAQLSMDAQATKSLTLSLFAGYIDTKTPSELNVFSGLALGRSLATRKSVTPLLAYRISSLSTFTGAFSKAHETLDGRIADTQTWTASLDRRMSKRDTLALRYERRLFDFSGGDKTEHSTADVVTFGWIGDVSPRAIVLLRAGPRFAKGAVTAEVLASMKRRMKRGLLTVTYAKSQATTLGKTGALDTQSLVATVVLRLARNLEIGTGPGLYHNSLRGKSLSAMRLNLEALWHFSPWFHLGAGFAFDLQQPDFDASGHIRRSALNVKLMVSPDQRQPLNIPSEEQ